MEDIHSMETRIHTALHILKGAARNVLGVDAKWTAGVFTSSTGGRLTLQFNRKPSEEEIREIEKTANDIIQKDIKIITHQLSRSEARERFGDEHLDLFPIPETIKMLTVVEIPGWNINACNKPHTRTTGEVGSITIKKVRFRNAKQLLEITFA
ncbi:MAG: alanyl-tRNA editing protein [Candidatus Odinarchaeota archaeon]